MNSSHTRVPMTSWIAIAALAALAACGQAAAPAPAGATLIPGGFGTNPNLDTGATTPQPDAGGSAGQTDAGPAAGEPDTAGGPTPPVDAGNPPDTKGGGDPGDDAGPAVDAGQPPEDTNGGNPPDTGPVTTCVDADNDGYGQGCAAGPDCDDGNPNFAAVCPDCTKDNFPGCACTGVATNCYSGDPAWIGKGVCQAGVRMCKGGFWGECNGEVLPSPEVCDAKDNNCNGLIDEGVLSTCGTCDMSCTQQKLGPAYGNAFDPGKDSSNGVGVDKNGYIILDSSKVNIDLNHIWVANSPEATVSKVDTNTGHEVGRYKICSNPSRTSVDLNGDVWVGCRGDGGVAKIINKKSACVDKNGNGNIETSEDLNKDNKIQPNEMVANDECLQFIVYPDGKTIARAAGVDKDNHAWMGFWSSKHLHRLEPTQGKSVAQVNLPCSPYGLTIDQKGTIWVQGAGCGLVEVDPKTLTTKKHKPPFSYQAYGINVDMFGKIWFGGGWGSVRFDPVTGGWVKVSAGGSSAVATGTDGYTYVVNDGPSTVTKINSVTATVEGKISLGAGRGPHGVAMDFNGFVWAVNLGKGTVSKCNPKTMQLVGEYPVGKSPYTYSDMTGYTLNNFTAPKGHYTHLFGVSSFGGQVAEAKGTTVWEMIDAELDVPAGAYVKVRYRAADTFKDIESAAWSKELGPFPPATFPVDLTKQGKVQARFLQVEVFLQASQKTKLSPILKSLTAKGKQTFQ